MLAFACAFTMFAGAAFTDQADINTDNVEAVDLLTTLGIIKGYEDGSFDPEGTVDRAEMAKMIYTIRNGGNDDASAHVDNTTSFTDISGHWAEGYIKYLQNTGIVAGKSATQFDPDSQVTTAEAMKMALALAGYDEVNAGLTGTAWLNNTVSLATTYGLTDNVASAISGGCSRQDAAQILANCLGMTAVRYSSIVENFVNDSENGLSYGGDPITVGNKWMDLTVYVGRMTSSGELYVDDTKAGKDSFKVDVDTVDGKAYTPSRRGSSILSFKDGQDHTDLVGMEVKVLTGEKIDEVYGVYATDTSKVVETTMDQVDVVEATGGYKLKVDGETYDTVGAEVFDDLNHVPYHVGENKAFSTNGEAVADTVKMIDWDDNGDYETILVNTVNVAEISYLGSKSLTLSSAGSKDGDIKGKTNSFDLDDVTIYEDAAKGDYVVFTKNVYDDSWNIVEATEVSGTVNGRVINERKIRVGGEWYTLANNKDGIEDDKDLYTVPTSRSEFTNGDEVTLYVVGNIVYMAKSATGNDANRPVLMVYDKQVKHDIWGNQRDQVKAIFADGTKDTITIDFNDEIKWLGDIKVGKMYHYDINNDDEYSLTSLVDGGEMAGYDRVVTDDNGINKAKSDKTYGGRTIADDAVVFALIGNDDADVYTGKDIKDVISSNDEWGQTDYGQALIASEAGFTYTRMMNIALKTGIDTGDLYAYVLNSSVASIDSDDTVARAAIARAATGTKVMEYDLWTAEGQIHAIEVTNDNKTDIVEGDIVTYSVVSEGEIEDVTKVTDYEIGAIIGGTEDKISIWTDEDHNNVFTDDILEADEDTVALFVDSKNSNMDEIGQADMDTFNFPASTVDDDETNINAKYIMGDDGNIKFILIDTQGKLKGEDPVKVEGYAISEVVEPEDDGWVSNVEISGNTTIADGKTWAARGTELTLDFDLDDNNRAVKVTLTGATFDGETDDTPYEKVFTGSQDNVPITVDGSAAKVTVSFASLQTKLETVLNQSNYKPAASATASYDIKTRVDGAYVANGDYVKVGDKVEVIVEMTAALGAANTHTITISNNGEAVGTVTFNLNSKVGDYKIVRFSVVNDDDINLTVTGNSAPTTQAKILSATMYDNKDTKVTTVADAKKIVVVFDTAMNSTEAEDGANWTGSNPNSGTAGSISKATLSTDGKTLTLIVDDPFASTEAFDDYSAVKTVDGAGISTTSVTFYDGSATATIVQA